MNSTSFGELSSAGTHICKTEENTSEHVKKCTKDQHRDVSLTKRAHLAEQTGAPCIMHTRKDIRAHMSAYQRRIRTRGGQVGPADPLGRPNLAGLLSWCISRRSRP